MKKSLVTTLSTLLFTTVILLFLLEPARYSKAFLDGLTIWAYNVLPVIFPFALLTTLYTKSVKQCKFSISKLLFGTSCDSVFLQSFLCGYPVGARAISELDLDKVTAAKLCSFCSTPGPIFVIATIGAAVNNGTATLIIFLSQVIAMILNGWLYTGRRALKIVVKNPRLQTKDFGETITNSILSVLTVGALIALFFMLSEMFQRLLSQSIANHPLLFFVIGMLEMTSGILKICQTCPLFVSTVCTSALLAFGGLCVALQCFAFVSAKGVTLAQLLKIKCTQCAFATIAAFVLGKIFL